eukprot:Tamp_10318.p1 GENE.Tamp_10318~~Tamp_10318.p1  ORF type:complete len:475 (+),score=111.32 Tamp_10318:55-1425(+)
MSTVGSVGLGGVAAFSASPLLPLSLRAPARTRSGCMDATLAAGGLGARGRGCGLAPSRALQHSLRPDLLRMPRGRGPRIRVGQAVHALRCSSSPLLDDMVKTPVGAYTEGVNVRVRLCMLRAPEVEDYEGPNKFEQDVAQILSEYAAFATDTDGWELLEQSEKGVLAIHHHAPASASVKIALLGLDAWNLNKIRRDAALPQEPFMELRISTSAEAEDSGQLATTTRQFIYDLMIRYSGEWYLTEDLPRLRNEDLEVEEDAEVDQSTVRPPSRSSVLQRAIATEDRPFMDTSSLTEWLLPEMLLQFDDDDMGVAGTTPKADRPEKEGYFGVYALNEQPPPTPDPATDPSERLWDPKTRLGQLSEEETLLLRRRGLNEMQPAPSEDDDDDDEGATGGRVRRARGRDFVEYKGREAEDLVQDGLAPAEMSAPVAPGAAQDVTDVSAEDVTGRDGGSQKA